MQAPTSAADEDLRLDTLRSFNILDTEPEERFDRLTRLAKRLFGVPIALVSLVDADRQWFKSSVGLAARETPRDISFCGHAILGDDILTIPDALRDERFQDNPLVTDAPNIRFYAGCPLRVANGSKLGTLCLIDTKPRDLSDEDKDLLRDLSQMVEQEIAAVALSTTDELTSLSNRRGFEALGQQAMNFCKRMRKPASLLFFDLNDFKKINDDFGHAEGDKALKRFADVLRQAFRESDVVARVGGDEFVAVLTDSDPQEVSRLTQRLGALLDAANSAAQGGYAVRFSVGHVPYDPGRHLSIQSLLAEADAAMYSDKQARKAA